MSPSQSRRALLVSLGTATVAGCLADSGTDPTETESSPSASETETAPSGTETESTPSAPEPPDSIDADWRMPGADPGFSNAAGAPGPTGPVGELWQFVADARLTAPIVAGGTVYVATADGDVVALDARSSDTQWRQSVGESAFTPRVVDGSLYVPTDSGIVSLDSDGQERWQIDTPGRDDSDAENTLRPGAPVLATADGLFWLRMDGEDEIPVVVANSLDDGSERWRTEIEAPWTRQLFAGGGTVFVPSGTNGQQAWRLRTESGDVASRPEMGYDFPAERLYRDGTVYSTEPFFGGASAAAVEDGGHSWNTGAPHGTHYVSAGPDRLYVGVARGEKPGLYTFSTTDGAEGWDAEMTPTNRPIVADEAVLVNGDSTLHCLDPTDGSTRWTRSNDDIDGRMAVAADVLFATDGATLRVFRPR